MKINKKNDLLKFSLNLLKKFVLICKILLIKNILKKIRGKPKDTLICGPSDLDNACTYEIVEIINIKAKSIFDGVENFLSLRANKKVKINPQIKIDIMILVALHESASLEKGIG